MHAVNGSFSFPEHWFLNNDLWEVLDHHALMSYVFPVLVGDRKGPPYCSHDKISNLLKVTVDDYIAARNDLVKKDLIAFDGQDETAGPRHYPSDAS